MSYNTLAFGFVLLVLVTLAGSENLSVSMCILCGMFTAGAVLANPYVVILFLLYGVICVGSAVWSHHTKNIGSSVSRGFPMR